MRIVTLMENTLGNQVENMGCVAEHGLSLYIETPKHKLLLDTGATGAFADNAKVLSVDLAQVDTLVLSHGHYDHAGGIMRFADINQNASIYIQNKAKFEYYHKSDIEERYIGIAPEISLLPTVNWVGERMHIDAELELFSNVKGRTLWPNGNRVLKQKVTDENGNVMFIQDEFEHEQYLVISCEGKKVLLSGCAHNGVINILEHYQMLYGDAPDAMISGFHMMKKTEYTEEEIRGIEETARICSRLKTKFFTGHCTGEHAFEIMKNIMGDQLQYLHTGDEMFLYN